MTRHARFTLSSFSFRLKLFIIFTTMTLLITVVFSTLYIRSEIKSQRRQAEQRVSLLAAHISSSISLPLFAENRDMLGVLLREAGERNSEIARITVTNRRGQTLGEFLRQPQPSDAHLLKKTAEIYSSNLSLSPEEALTDSSSGVTVIGNLSIALDNSEMPAVIRQMAFKSVTLAFFFWVAVSLLSYLVLQQITRTFKTLMDGIEIIKGGNYAISIPVERDDEPGRAAAAVNGLATALRDREEENRRLQEELFQALRLEVQEEKKRLMAKLIQTNRMTFLGMLASSMAHEINNPNGAIRLAGLYLSKSWLDAMPLLQRVAEEEGDFSLGGIPFSTARKEIMGSCATIERNTELISGVVKDLRSYSLGERHEFSSDVNVNQVIENAVATIRAYGRHANMQVEQELADELPLIHGSRHQLEQVLINLISNALQALPQDGGTVTITSRENRASGQIEIVVRDNGEGIPPENLERLFEPFFSTKLDKGGSGLGLFVTSFIVSQHNGSIDFASTPGQGTTVTVMLPLP